MPAPSECAVEVGDDQVWVGTFQSILTFSKSRMVQEKQINGHKGMVHDLVVVNDNIWSCSSDKTIKVWNEDVRCVVCLVALFAYMV